MTTITKNGVTVQWIRQNEVNDIFHVSGNGINEYVYYPRSSGMDCQDIIELFI